MDIDKVRALTDTEIGTELVSQRRNLYDLRFQLATRQLTDHSQLTATRRTIARLLTVMTERGLDESIVARSQPAESRRPVTRGRGRTTATKTTTSGRGKAAATTREAAATKEVAAKGAEE